MNVNVYAIKCLTNLHVGSGEVNYNVIDNEVEKDAVTGYPVVHASGLKGALREHFEKTTMSKEEIKNVFGQESGAEEIKAGEYKFFDAKILGRPMRVNDNSMASVMVVSVDSVNAFIRLMNDFGINTFGKKLIEKIDFDNLNFVSECCKSIEGEDVGKVPDQAKEVMNKLSSVIGSQYAIVKDFNEYDLPVVARNKLDNGESKHLWYEEVVPHDSIFYTLILTPDDNMKLQMEEEKFIQIGGHASVGCGFTKWTKIDGQKSTEEGTADEQNKSE